MRKLILVVLVVMMTVSMLYTFNVSAMTTYKFDKGMEKGIEYFNQGMFYDAKNEFQWFCDYNWGEMNPEQQKYALDYLGAAKIRIIDTPATINTDLVIKYYFGTNVPDYTYVTGIEQKSFPYYGDSGLVTYIYRDTEIGGHSEVADYMSYLKNDGWSLYDEKKDNNHYSITWYYVKSGKMIGVYFNTEYDEIWIIV